MLDQGRGHILQNRQRREQRALLEQHAGAPLDIGHIRLGRSGHVMAQQMDAAAIGLLQADDGVQQNRLAGSGSADHAQNLSPHDVQLQILVDHSLAKLAKQAPHLDDRLRLPGHMFSSRKIRANTASRKMMAKMACTTAAVTRRPRDSTSPETAIP